ncbi:hypothetical protein B0H13DRAFT_1926614 [Mycena leptocephala]|nr:hypothetical protein B0H13DRAFT_1926614 [Mycena leptocephala]
MASYGLDLDSREANGNRWSVQWSTSKDGGNIKRVLLQCDCGYDHRQAGFTKRRTAVDFTGCLAHAEITFVKDSQKIPHRSAQRSLRVDWPKIMVFETTPARGTTWFGRLGESRQNAEEGDERRSKDRRSHAHLAGGIATLGSKQC